MSELNDTQPQAAEAGPAQPLRRSARAVAPPIVIAAGEPRAPSDMESSPAAPAAPATAVEVIPGQQGVVETEKAAGPGIAPGAAGDVIDLIAPGGTSRRAEARGEDEDDRVTRVERRDPAMLAQLAEALALIAGGGEPFGAFALPSRGALTSDGPTTDGGPDTGAGARGGQRRRGERRAIAPTTAATSDAARQHGDGAGVDTASEAARWPTGPIVGYDQLSARELEGLVEKMLCDPEIMADPSYPGLSRQRLRNAARRAGLEPHRFGKFSPWVELWLARAGITARRVSTEGEWNSPRPLQLEEKEEIRQALLRTPWPTRRDIEEARAQGLGEGIL